MPANGRQLGRCPGRPFLFFGPGLVHEPPQSLIPSFPLHQVSGPFQQSAGADLVHRSPQGLVLSSPLHQVSRPFRRSAGTDLVHKSQQSLVLSSPLHQVSGPFQRSAGALKAEKGAVALNNAAVPFSCTFFEAVLMQFLMKPLETTAFIKK